VKWGVKMIEIRWISSDMLHLDKVDRLLIRKKKKVMVEKS